jgi:hypothetical protein
VGLSPGWGARWADNIAKLARIPARAEVDAVEERE